MVTVRLRAGRERSLERRHPWVFSGAIASVGGSPAPGDTVDIVSAEGRWLARGAYSPASQIRVRVWTFDEAEPVDEAFFGRRIAAALEARSGLSGTDAYRLVYAESDGLPGVIVDRYADFLVCQFLSAGAEQWRATVVNQLAEQCAPQGIYERSDADVRRLEGLPKRSGVLGGAEPPELIAVREEPVRYLVDVRGGHKTGLYLDQREHRALVNAAAGGAAVLNVFSYTGGFGLAAAVGGARSVVNIETSAAANALAWRNAKLNGIGAERFTIEERDAFQVLRDYRDAGRTFDLIVLDPPKFAESRGQVEAAARGYKDLNLLALRMLRPRGLLYTFSCSGHIKADLFQKIVAAAALDAGRDAHIIRQLGQPPDHAVALTFPEAAYLKGLIVRA